MGERDNLLISIADSIQTYRADELDVPTPAHVDKWASQFSPANQLPFLREFNHVINQTFLTKDKITHFLITTAKAEKLVGKDPGSYWSRANVLLIQKKGQSQREMVSLFSSILKQQFGLELARCGVPDGDYIYLDDVLFGGGRVQTDLDSWIRDKAPQNCKVHIILLGYHQLGQYFASNHLTKVIRESGKKVQFTFWRLLEIENRKYQKNISEVLWPALVPPDPEVEQYVASIKKHPLELRQPGGKSRLFSSEAGRQALESEFLIAGVKIRSMSDPVDFYRPLGCGNFGVGFGAMIVTYRNCPNNCPLALWWGDPTATSGALRWYPLLGRKTYDSPENVFGSYAHEF